MAEYIPVVCTGRQPNSDVFVVGQNLQFNNRGKQIPEDVQQYIWVPEIMKKLHIDKISAPVDTIETISHAPTKKVITINGTSIWRQLNQHHLHAE